MFIKLVWTITIVKRKDIRKFNRIKILLLNRKRRVWFYLSIIHFFLILEIIQIKKSNPNIWIMNHNISKYHFYWSYRSSNQIEPSIVDDVKNRS